MSARCADPFQVDQRGGELVISTVLYSCGIPDSYSMCVLMHTPKLWEGVLAGWLDREEHFSQERH